MKAKCHNMEKKDAVFSKEHLCGGKIIETLWTRTQKADHEMGLLTTNKG